MTTTAPFSPVDVRPQLSPAEFYAEYANKKPVLMKGAIADFPAASRWSVEHLAELAPDLEVRLKTGLVSEGRTATARLADYCQAVTEWEQKTPAEQDAAQPPAYLHDIPLLSLIPELRRDLQPFPAEFLPEFFRDEWWAFTQFFVGPSRALTPLHFDTLLTHNLFFQIHGSKRWVLIDAADRDLCYTYNWRWSPVDPDAPDFERFPRFRGARIRTCVVEAGDLFYMPPGTLHKVTSLTASVSFNIDWHDRLSSRRGLTAVRHGMPLQNLRYNLLFALGLWARIPHRVLMPALKSYFTYIS
ncbi:cupin-like domain-containing protein [Saccharopolyspora shandongensis]|uniref:Cupin-like domain-containing protein n=1 Tax=Saccharopolyspora shandongensis TaxID=418495 RepID=A0A1H3BB88_9PSEU|nr:cupin-like domain-containing protein [Saccharopolyspora shandongensis]SDX38694.1 Cupin-like domain-containing protein [Saccharopolyspora shandongensis]